MAPAPGVGSHGKSFCLKRNPSFVHGIFDRVFLLGAGQRFCTNPIKRAMIAIAIHINVRLNWRSTVLARPRTQIPDLQTSLDRPHELEVRRVH